MLESLPVRDQVEKSCRGRQPERGRSGSGVTEFDQPENIKRQCSAA